jgi:cobalamin biosynthesis protein CobT
VEGEQDGGEEMRDTEENINESENSDMNMERSPSVSKGGTSAKDVEGEQDGREQMRDSEENMNSRTDMQAPPSVSVNNKDQANSATSIDYNTLTTRYSSFTPPAGCVLNDEEYVDKVANYIVCSLYKYLKKGHLHSFLQRRDRAQSRQTHADCQFWEKADPKIDAWMLEREE